MCSVRGGVGLGWRIDRLARRRVDVVADTCCGDLCAVCGEGVWVYTDRLARRRVDIVTDACCVGVCAVCGAGTYGQDCREMCGRCQDGAACNHISGHCPACASHFTMPFCSGE